MGIELRIFTAAPGLRWGGGGGDARPLIGAQRCNWAAENVLLVRRREGKDQVSGRPSFNFATC